ncbi:hypothetical protein IFM89_017275 [Coptis chinensis]|uniref:Major facilitator superfamily (MFS) profile domain-containing protein n=1 Tax=Coptis chinensis TaxID=261450 RepID=A0A835IA46_9MAGN|nr:hypothetical protein IFM89_017275 [Coptis chinensis]
MKGRTEEAKRVLLRTSERGEEEVELKLVEIALAAESTKNNDWHGQGVWRSLLVKPTRSVRRILVAAIGLNFFMQASGVDAVVYYCPEVFKSAGIIQRKELFLVNVVMGLAKTTFVLLSAFYLDRFGRRPLLLLGNWASVHYVSFFSIGLGPITWVYSSEIFPLRLRAQGTSIAVSVNRLVSSVVSMSFLSISQKITFGGVLLVLAEVAALSVLFIYVTLPETKGKKLEDVEELFDSHRGKRCEIE